MKKIIILIFTLIFVFVHSFNAYAYDVDFNPGVCAGVDDMLRLVKDWFGESSDYYCYTPVGNWSTKTCTTDIMIIPENYCVLVGNVFSTNDDGSPLSYYAYLCHYQNETLYKDSSYDYYRFSVTSGTDGNGTLIRTTKEPLYFRADYYMMMTSYPNTDSSSYAWSPVVNVPVVTNEDDAIKWLTTQDTSVLYNNDSFISDYYERMYDVPKPSNVSIYQASNEKNVYVYWEQTKNELIYYDFPFNTNITVDYCYVDSNGNEKNLESDDVDIGNDFFTISTTIRNQQAISYLPLVIYDTGFIEIDIWNDITLDNGHIVSSDVVTLKYYLETGEYTKQIFDNDGNSYDDDVISFTVPDYLNKNDSYTGGNPIISHITTGDNSDFSIFGSITSLFGLIGDNGVINAMQEIFTFYPSEIFKLIYYGMLCTVIICLVKYAIK